MTDRTIPVLTTPHRWVAARRLPALLLALLAARRACSTPAAAEASCVDVDLLALWTSLGGSR